MSLLTLTATIVAGWLVLLTALTGLWCLVISRYGTRACNPPAIRAARHAAMRARHDFVTTHMTRNPVHP